jgi:hypothetical protein
MVEEITKLLEKELPAVMSEADKDAQMQHVAFSFETFLEFSGSTY